MQLIDLDVERTDVVKYLPGSELRWAMAPKTYIAVIHIVGGGGEPLKFAWQSLGARKLVPISNFVSNIGLTLIKWNLTIKYLSNYF